MTRYDPARAPDPQRWLSMDEQERILLVEQHHKRAGERLPNVTLHAATHAVVENQLALGDEQVAATLVPPMSGGLDRQESLHAVGSVLAGCLFDGLRDTAGTTDLGAIYYEKLRALSVESWRNGR